jgi:hypothetical protein
MTHVTRYSLVNEYKQVLEGGLEYIGKQTMNKSMEPWRLIERLNEQHIGLCDIKTK